MTRLLDLGPGLWLADGADPVTVAGFDYPVRMAVVQLSDGGLLLWSPIRPTPGLLAEVTGLGPVRHIVAPNSLHHLFLPDWIAACPGAAVHGAPGLARKRRDIAFDSELTDTPHAGWTGDLAQVVVRGNLITAEVVFFHRASGTALFTDLLQQIPAASLSGWRATIARLDRMTGPEPAVPRKFRLAQVNRAEGRRAVERILAWPVQRVVMAHGTPVLQDAPAFLRRAFAWLRPAVARD